METKQKDFFGKVGNTLLYSDRIEYIIKLDNTADLLEYYELIKTKCYTTNFGLNPYETFAYGTFILNDVEYTISNPTTSNGDNNWWSYDNELTKYCTITTLK